MSAAKFLLEKKEYRLIYKCNNLHNNKRRNTFFLACSFFKYTLKLNQVQSL